MYRQDGRILAQFIAAVALVAASSVAMAADGEAWWQRVEGYASAGIGAVKARPDTGGRITLSFDADTTTGLDKAVDAGSGLRTEHVLPVLQLGGRFEVLDDLTVGLEGQYYEFADAVSTAPADREDVPPQPNFATFTEDSQFKLRAMDIGATAGYSRWGGTAELFGGYRDAYYRTRAQIHTFGVFTSGNFVNLLLANGAFWEGDGASLGLRLSYRIQDLPLRIIARYGYAKLDGKSTSFGRSAGTVASSPSPPLVGAATVTRADADSKMEIHDQEYGLQWDLARGLAFARVSWTKSKWTLDGPGTGGAGFGGTIGTLTTNSFSSAGLGGGELTGTRLTLGVTF
jgi:hypothetical protein